VESFRFTTTSITLPLGLAYIAGALEASGRTVHVIDAVGEQPETCIRYFQGYLVGLPLEEIVARVPREAAMLGITVVFTHEWPVVVRLVELLKAARPDLCVVLGGEHITSMPEFSLLTSRADLIVLGEGEETVVELAEALESGRPLSEVAGAGYRDGAGVAVNPRRVRKLDVDAIPLPAWHHFKVVVYHAQRFVGGMYSSSLTIPILATRGCPYQCTYCSAPNMWTPRWLPRDPAKVADEIQSYVETYGARNFPFQDLTAIIQKDWIVRFCREVLARGLDITWQLPTGTRSEAIDSEVAHLLRRSGMISMSYAPESGSEETRRFIKKQMRTDRLLASMEAAVEAELNVSVFLVIGFPHDIHENVAENLPFIDRITATGMTDCNVGFYMALPGTELFHSLYDAGKLQIDRAYFRHILAAQQFLCSQSYCDGLDRTDLTIWKFRLLWRFYSQKHRRATAGGFATSLRRGLSGLAGSGGHESKLQTAFRVGVNSGIETIRTKLKPGWMSRAEERRLFEGWDEIFREVRRRNLEGGADQPYPTDTRELHRSNVISALRRAHETRRAIAQSS
jgi:radical SAM superfamily enzyme YgiQ (UPF0313 family)